MSVRRGCLFAALLVTGALALAACDDAGAPAAPSAPAPPPPTPRPPPPVNLKIVSGDRTVVLTWESPGGASGALITNYEVRVLTIAGPTAWDRTADAAGLTYAIAGLTNGVEYAFEVRSVNNNGTPNDSGDDAFSDPVSVTGTPVEPPPPPVNLRAIPGDREVTLLWDPPLLPEGAGAEPLRNGGVDLGRRADRRRLAGDCRRDDDRDVLQPDERRAVHLRGPLGERQRDPERSVRRHHRQGAPRHGHAGGAASPAGQPEGGSR